MKIMCQVYFDAVVRYAESIGDCTLQSASTGLSGGAKTLVRQAK